MTGKGNILVGTVGQGVMTSADDGESWTRASVRQGMHSDCIVRMLRADSRSPEVVYAGTDFGLYRSDDGGGKWRLLDNPMRGSMVWSMAIDPADSAVMFAGTGTPSTPGIFRSTDGGKSWARLSVEIADDCPNVGVPRPTGIAIDPTNDRNVWVGLEVDGVRYSRDGGETWAKLNGQIANQDVHSVSGAAELGDLDRRDLGHGARHDVRRQPLRLSLSQRRRGRLLAQALAGVRRSLVDPVDSKVAAVRAAGRRGAGAPPAAARQ